MPKKLTPEQIELRETLEKLRKQCEKGLLASAQVSRIETALAALQGVKNDIAQLNNYVDDVIKTLKCDDSTTAGAADQGGEQDQIGGQGSDDPLEQELFGDQVIPINTFKIDVFKCEEDGKYKMSMGTATVESESLKTGVVELFAYHHLLADSPELLAEKITEMFPETSPARDSIISYLVPVKAVK